MAIRYKMGKLKFFPRPHNTTNSWSYELDDSTIRATIYPIVMYDEGKGAPDTYNANPEHASFSDTQAPNCFVGSRINNINTTLEMSVTTAFFDDNLTAVKYAYMPIYTSFKEDLTAINEKTSEEVQDILELQSESTDRQAYPLWNGSKMAERFTNSGQLHTDVPGLTTNQKIEAVTFSIDAFYDNLQYYTTAGKLKKCIGGLKWGTLSRTSNHKTHKIRFPTKIKALNEYTFFGILVIVPQVDTEYQIPHTADITASTKYVNASIKTRFNEWNQGFDMEKV